MEQQSVLLRATFILTTTVETVNRFIVSSRLLNYYNFVKIICIVSFTVGLYSNAKGRYCSTVYEYCITVLV